MTRKQIKSYITFALVLGLVVGVFTVFFEKTVNYLLIFEDGKKFQDYQNVYVLGGEETILREDRAVVHFVTYCADQKELQLGLRLNKNDAKESWIDGYTFRVTNDDTGETFQDVVFYTKEFKGKYAYFRLQMPMDLPIGELQSLSISIQNPQGEEILQGKLVRSQDDVHKMTSYKESNGKYEIEG